ncbi:IPTL-CTERM sorting domain-containing protein [Methylomonas rivi]|uniref:IPTL-CTERM sorting domain-containing protein n=1 Tax=Methylomonas rivi TaxID=2952226 RepID=A0ABT1U8C3_9GAMM|nr:IPTL-CTERM sorting domain-containing protein [Methylomonas sp. WSC-6]MCQ8129768.1 IPTL-CTERM sorting domain-containing protein [Methylomonas sp. WSC-6]
MATASLAAPIDDARFKAMAWLITHQNGDGSWSGAPGLEMAETAAAVEALVNSGMTQSDTYTKGVAWLQNHEAYSTDALARQIIALNKAGRDTSELITRLIALRNDTSLSWGAYDHYSGSFPDTSLAMDAINATATTYADASYGIGFIVNKQNTDGGWPYFAPPGSVQPSKVIPAAHSLLTLNHYKTVYGVQSNITNGIAWLKAQQKTPGGGFGEGSTGTVLETALAYRALVAELGPTDPAAVSAENFLIAQQQTDGSWGGGDALLTTLTLAAMPTVALADTDRDGLPDGTETQALLGTNPNLPDAFGLLSGNGRGIAGETTAIPLTKAFIDLPYTASLATSNGTPPYSWLLSSGDLPDGLSLDSNTGEITGTPTALGIYNFSYEVLAADRQTSIVSQIEVTEPQPTQVPTLPAWAMLLMGGLLSVIMRHAEHRKTRTIR